MCVFIGEPEYIAVNKNQTGHVLIFIIKNKGLN